MIQNRRILLYVLNLSLLSTHQADASAAKEWELFGIPGGLAAFLVFHFLALLVLGYGLVQVIHHTKKSRIWAGGIAVLGLVTFSIHAAMLAVGGSEAFRNLASIVILIAVLLTSFGQILELWFEKRK